MTLAVSVSGLQKSYGATRAVDDVNLAVGEGEIFGILGPNGSGKTTTVECTYGLRTADHGTIRVFGLDPRSDPDGVGRLVGAQLQDTALPDRIKVEEAIHLFSAMARRPVDEAGLLSQWGLVSKRRASYGSLSGGQRQRLHVALALASQPRLVFLDEMTTGLDPNARREVWGLVERVRQAGTTVVLVTHFMDEAQRLCDRVAVLVDGRVVADGTPSHLVSEHGGDTTVGFRITPSQRLPDLRRVPGVRDVIDRHGAIEVCGRGAFLVGLGHALAGAGLGDMEIVVEQPSLEDAYVHLVAAAAPSGASLEG